MASRFFRRGFRVAVVATLAVLVAFWILTHHTDTILVVRDVAGVPVIEISGMFDAEGARQILRSLRTVEKRGASLIVFSLDSPGGELAATFDVSEAINHTSIPTACLVRNGVGGSLFVVAAVDRIFFAPDGVCGAAAPIMGYDRSDQDAFRQKVVAYIRAKVKALADAHGHDPEIFAAMIDANVELVRGTKVWKKKGELLALTAREAVELGFAEGIAATPEDVIARSRKAD